MRSPLHYLRILGFSVLILLGCRTDDVSATDHDTSNWIEIPDNAFGEYMVYKAVKGVYKISEDGTDKFYLNPEEVKSVTELSLSKTASNVEELKNANLITAETKITNLSGIEYFTGLEHIVLTSNSVTSLNTSSMPQLQQLELNFNLIGTLDLTQNPNLTVLRYRGSASADNSQKLSTLDLTQNTALKHLFLPAHNFVTINLANNSALNEMLDMSGNPGPDGNPNTGDIVVPAAIYNQLDPANRLGVIPAIGNPLAVFSASETVISEGSSTLLKLALNTASTQNVSAQLTITGTATLGDDFTIGTQTLTIPAGQVEITTPIEALSDTNTEGAETINVEISNVTNATISGNSSITITINDGGTTPNLIINEVLYDPSNTGLDGDANGDGVYNQAQDEFIEFYNDSNSSLDMSGYQIFDADGLSSNTPNHTFPSGTSVPAHKSIVVFGGGTPTGSFGGAIVQTSTTGNLNLNNDDDFITVKDAQGNVVVTFNIEPFSNNPNESYTRNPDITGGFVQHTTVNSSLFSPGKKVDGSSF